MYNQRPNLFSSRKFTERLTEPLHLNLLAFIVWIFGSYKTKIQFDLIKKLPYAFGIWKAAEMAQDLNFKRLTVIEFGVGHGDGLLRMQSICSKITKITGINFDIYGFDICSGMPSTKSYKDSPEAFKKGSYRTNLEMLKPKLSENVELVIGDVTETIAPWMKSKLKVESPIAFVSFDLDMYYGTKAAMQVLDADQQFYLPFFWCYLDDIRTPGASNKIGELLAEKEFNDSHEYRSLTVYPFLECERVFKNAAWLKQMRIFNVFDYESRSGSN